MNRTVAAALALIIALPLLVAPTPTAADGGAKLTMLSVGAGQCAVMQLPGGRIVLFDAGSQTPDLWRRCLAPFLKSQALSKVDSIYISHANYDHFSAAADAARLGGARHVMIGPGFAAQAKQHLAGRHLLDSLHDPPLVISAGKKIELDKQSVLEVLWPPERTELRDNDASLVLKITTRGRTILFTGDIQDSAMKGLLARPETLKCDVLVAPHHGSSELMTLEFVNACDPNFILSSNDNTLTQKQKTFEKMLEDRALYRTNRCGAITVTIDKMGAIRTKTFLRSVEPNVR